MTYFILYVYKKIKNFIKNSLYDILYKYIDSLKNKTKYNNDKFWWRVE